MDIKQIEPYQLLKASTNAIDMIKQIITLSSGALALSVTFLVRFENLSLLHVFSIGAFWVSLIISIMFGLNSISIIIRSQAEGDNNWLDGKGRKSGFISKLLFSFGMIILAWFAISMFVFPMNISNHTYQDIDQANSSIPLIMLNTNVSF